MAPKEEQRLTCIALTWEQTMDLLKAVPPRDPVSMGDRSILELLYACGIRTTELWNLKVSEVDLTEQTVVIVNGKGGKSRIVPIGQYASHYIGRYLESGRKRLLMGKRTDPGNLFLSSRGSPFTRETISKSVMGRANKLLGGEKRISDYSLRYAVASDLIANGMDVERFPSGKLSVNAILLHIAMVVFNTLRFIGQTAMRFASSLPYRHKGKRKRLRRVISDLIRVSCKVVRHANRWTLRLWEGDPWLGVFRNVYQAI